MAAVVGIAWVLSLAAAFFLGAAFAVHPLTATSRANVSADTLLSMARGLTLLATGFGLLAGAVVLTWFLTSRFS